MTRLRELDEQRALLAQAILDRAATDPLLIFQPTPKQKPFIESVLYGKKAENWFVAANRSGKSDAGAYIGSSLARFGGDPRSAYSEGGTVEVRDRATSGWVSSIDFPTSRDIIEPKYFNNGFVPPGATHDPFIPDREISEWRVSDRVLKLKNGSIVGFKSADAGRKKYQGAEKDWIHFDEEHEKGIYGESSIRIGARPLRIFGTVTLLPPEGTVGGVTWMYNDMIKPWLQQRMPDLGLFSASIYDNPHIDQREIARLEAKFPPGSVEGRIRLGGEWLPGLSGTRAYASFENQSHVRTQPWPPIPRKPLVWFWDFNVSPLVTGIGQRDGRLFRVMRELVLEEGSTAEMCQVFYDLVGQHFGELWIYGDATGARMESRHTASDQSRARYSDYQIIRSEMRKFGSPIRLRLPTHNPPVTNRVNAVNVALRNEQGLSLVEIDPSCVELIADLEGVLRDGQGGIKKTRDPKSPYYRRGHSSDGFGYWVHYEEPVKPRSPWDQQTKPQIGMPGYAWAQR